MVDIREIEKCASDMTQMAFARIITFDFNKGLVSLACSQWGDKDYENLLLQIIDNKTLLVNSAEPIFEFFNRVSNRSVLVTEAHEDVRPLVKNGIHMERAKTFVSTAGYYVSTNEMNYCLRQAPWFIKTYNPVFSDVINEDMTRLLLVVDSTFDLSTLKEKEDVSACDNVSVTLKDGRVFSIVVA